MTLDPRRACKFCLDFHGKLRPATRVAGQHTGGDDDIPATWVPVCEEHFAGWWDNTDPMDRLPAFTLTPQEDA